MIREDSVTLLLQVLIITFKMYVCKVLFLFVIFHYHPSVLGLLDILPTYNNVELRVYQKTMDNYKVFTLGNPNGILQYLNQTLQTFWYAFGLNGSATGPATTRVITTMLDVGGCNVVLLDWSKYAQILGVPLVPPEFTGSISYAASASPHAEGVGCKFGNVLVQLSEVGIPNSQVVGLQMSKVYLAGHSLGAHLMGQAGRCAKKKGVIVPRITGMDPAGILFQGPLSFSALDYQCADYVDIIHTDPGNLGTNTSIGTVDIYPNFSFEGEVQPGCPVGKYPFLSPEATCSHDRSWMYYCEGVRYISNLAAAGADDFNAWKDGQDKGLTFIGFNTIPEAQGNYYLVTNSESLYGKGLLGTRPPE